jgi:hypothetical protein
MAVDQHSSHQITGPRRLEQTGNVIDARTVREPERL